MFDSPTFRFILKLYFRAFLIAAMIAIALLPLYCLIASLGDRGLEVYGSIYEWVDAPASSTGIIYVGDSSGSNTVLQGKSVIPLDLTDTSISFWYVWRGKLGDIEAQVKSINAANEFYVNEFGGIPPKVSLKAERPGYKTLNSKEFKVGYDLRAVILLVRQK